MSSSIVKGSIVNPATGSLESRETVLISPEDAQLLRHYKKFLQRYGLKEALYCASCWNKSLSDGCDASVTDSRIVIVCRCSIRTTGGT